MNIFFGILLVIFIILIIVLLWWAFNNNNKKCDGDNKNGDKSTLAEVILILMGMIIFILFMGIILVSFNIPGMIVTISVVSAIISFVFTILLFISVYAAFKYSNFKCFPFGVLGNNNGSNNCDNINNRCDDNWDDAEDNQCDCPKCKPEIDCDNME